MTKQAGEDMENRIDVICAAYGITQKELASLLGIRQQSLNYIAVGKNNPSGATILKMSYIFDMDARELFMLKDIPPTLKKPKEYVKTRQVQLEK